MFCTLVLLVSVLVPSTGSAPAHAQQVPTPPTASPTPPRVDQGLVRRLSQEGNGQATIEYHRETGMVRFVGTRPGQPIGRAVGVAATASPADAARGFMATYGPLFGVQDQARELTVKRERPDTGGRSVVRFAQQHQGIPVFAGEVVVNLDRARNVQAATGELLPDISVDTTPKISKGEAHDAALAAVARTEELEAGQLNASEPELWIYNRALVGDPGPKITQLVWHLEVRAGQADPVRYLVLVDAHSGAIALQFNQIAHAKNRNTYDLNHSTTSGTLVCNESNPTCAGQIPDAVAAHVYAGQTYDFYQEIHGRDSLDGAGMTLRSFVRYGTNYQNAFWNGFEMVYGDGFSLADDVVAHELTHGVTEFESGLMYFRQAGAINESLSDIWGEFVDLTNGAGNDTPAVKWQLAEDLSGFGPIRSLSDPPAFNHPDRITSPHWWSHVTDGGGVHRNSGVNNKAAFLLTDGGTFNGKTVTGLGIDKVAKIYYEVQTNLLTPGSDYADLYTAMQQACSTLVTTGVTTAADCQEVLDAIQAVEMHLLPTAGAAVQAPVCPGGQSPINVFFDDLENTATTNSNFGSQILSGTVNGWSYPQPPQYTNTTSGTKNFHALNRNTTGSYVMTRLADVTLPANAFLRFNHAWTFDTDDRSATTATFWDGAILEYSTNSGGTWLNASSLITHGGYTGTLATSGQGNTNPLAGQQAWVGNSDYGSTRVDLSTLAGLPFRFRFRVGTDSVNSDDGWFIDDVRIYTCAAGGPAAGVTVTPTSGLTTTEAGGAATFTVVLTTVPTSNVTIDLSSSDATEGRVSPLSLLFTPLNALTPQTVTVTGIDDATLDGDEAYTIVTAPAASTDASYDGVNPADVAVSNTDNEVPTIGITVHPTTGLITTEAGGQATFTVVLDSVPSANVTIGLSSSDTTEGTVSPSSLTFMPGDALTPQTVTVTGVDDTVDDGDVAYTIVTAPAVSTDGNYNTLNPSDVVVTNVDDEVMHALTVTTTGNGTVSGPGISCGADCSESYANGTAVTLTATPAAGSRFTGWSGVCTGTNTCQITMDSAKSVTATFEANVAVSVEGSGSLPNGDKVLIATIASRPGCGPITQVRFGTEGLTFQNARISITTPSGGPTNMTTGFVYTPPTGTTSLTLSIQRVVPASSATVELVLSYQSCSDWRTFVGGGEDAFR